MSNDYTPVHCAAENGKSDMLKLLLQHMEDSSGDTPLHIAVDTTHSHCVALKKDSLEIA